MKNITTINPGHIILLCLMAVFAASCDSDIHTGDSDPLPILLSAEMKKPDAQLRDLISGSQPLPDGLDVGAYISEENSGTPIYSNIHYRTDASGNLVLQAGQTQPYYPANGGEAKINAYYPRNSEVDDIYTFAVKTDQSTDENYMASTLLYSTGSYAHSRSALILPFAFKMARITYVLVKGNDITDSDISQATVTILNAETAVTFNRATGNVVTDTGQQSNIIPHVSRSAIIAPQTFSNGTSVLMVSVGGNNYYVKAPAGGWAVNSGESLNLTVTANKTGISLKYTLNNWGNGTVEDNDGNVTVYN